jgi:exodeoxyribonuclease VIII
MSQSRIKRIDESIPEFLKPFEDKPCFELGKALHNRVLTPHLEEYVVEPEGNKRLKDFRELLKYFAKANKDKAIISADQAVDLEKMVKSFEAHKTAVDLLSLADHIEVSAFVEIEGMRFKCRADWLMDEEFGIGDLKSTRSAKPSKFQWLARDLGYYVQAWLYCQAFERNKFTIVATENCGHFITQVFEVSPKNMMYGRETLLRCIEKYRAWKATKDRPMTYSGTWEIVTL